MYGQKAGGMDGDTETPQCGTPPNRAHTYSYYDYHWCAGTTTRHNGRHVRDGAFKVHQNSRTQPHTRTACTRLQFVGNTVPHTGTSRSYRPSVLGCKCPATTSSVSSPMAEVRAYQQQWQSQKTLYKTPFFHHSGHNVSAKCNYKKAKRLPATLLALDEADLTGVLSYPSMPGVAARRCPLFQAPWGSARIEEIHVYL